MGLLPSLKERRRYILFEIKADKEFLWSDVQEAVDAGLLLFLGQLGLSKACPLFLKERYQLNKFTLKVNHTSVDDVKAAVIFIKSIKNNPVLIRSLRTSGTLKKLLGGPSPYSKGKKVQKKYSDNKLYNKREN